MAKLTNQEKQFLKTLIKPVQPTLKLAWLLMLVSTLVFIAQAWILATIFSEWLNSQFTNTPLNTNILWQWLPWLVACFAIRPLLQFVRENISNKASLNIRTKLRKRLLTSLETLGSARSQFGSDGSISSQVIEQTDALDGYISRFSVQKQVAGTTPLILLIAVAWQSPLAAGILLLTAPLVPIFMILIGNMTAQKSAKQFMALSQLSGRFLDWVRGMTTLKRLQTTHIAEHDLANASEDYRRRTMDVLKLAFLNGAVLEFLSALCIALVAVYLGFGLMGILPWDKNNVPVAYFGALYILILTPEFYAPLRQLGVDYHAQAQAEGAVQSLLPILNKAEELQEAQNIQKNEQDTSQTADTKNKQLIDWQTSAAPSIDIRELAIYHQVTDIEANASEDSDAVENEANQIIRTRLAPISFNIQSGKRVALVGESGSGKSSLIQAIMGFANYEGSLNINAVNHKNINLDEFRAHIGYLAQTVALLPMSIADNLRLANPTASDDELITVLKDVELYELIKRLPNGINTLLGERGRGLSGGQQQRLGLAQLLLRDSKLWLLDEPTEHLDPDTAERIHTLLQKVSQGKTVIWITHAVEQLNWLDDVIKIAAHVKNNNDHNLQGEQHD